MSKVDDGGQAFPGRRLKICNEKKEIAEFPEEGMTYRQWLCGMALQGHIAHGGLEGNMLPDNDFAIMILEYADALIKAEQESRTTDQ